MGKDRMSMLLLRTTISFTLLFWTIPGSPAQAQEVIVNSNVPQRTVTKSSLRAIFSMRTRQWSNGASIKVFVLPPENPIHMLFSKGVLNTFPHQLKRAWDILVYSGTGQAPTEVGSAQDMMKAVSSTPGAIGYVPSDFPRTGGESEHIAILEVR